MNRHEKGATGRKPVVIRAGNASVKIYRGKSRGYDLFTVVHYLDGERKRETFGSLLAARARASEVATLIDRGQRDVLTLTSADRESYVRAVQLLTPLGIPLHAAIEEYVAARALLGEATVLTAAKDYARRHQSIVAEKSTSEIVEELLKAKARDGVSARYLETLRSHLHRFGASFQTIIGSVTAQMIDRWLAAQKVSARTHNNLLRSIVTLFHFARAQGYLPRDQTVEARHVGRAKDRGGDIGILTPAQLADLLKAANAEAALYLALGAFTGVRSAEMLRLDWQDFNFERGHIHIAPSKAKTATRRLVPIHPNLMQWLAPYKGRRGCVFTSKKTAKRTIAFAKEQGIEWPQNALRHSYATYRMAQTHNAACVADEMGNSPQMLFRNYRELADEHDALAWFSIEPKQAPNVVAMTI